MFSFATNVVNIVAHSSSLLRVPFYPRYSLSVLIHLSLSLLCRGSHRIRITRLYVQNILSGEISNWCDIFISLITYILANKIAVKTSSSVQVSQKAM